MAHFSSPGIGTSTGMCSINICGLSYKSNLMLQKYIVDQKIGVIGFQETGTNDDNKLQLVNRNCIKDKNRAKLKVVHCLFATPL